MATKSATHTDRRLVRRLVHRLGTVSRTVFGHWLLALTSHTIALIILLVLERYIHPTWCGR